jgi:integrase
MSVRVRKRNGVWWVYISLHGRRKAKKVGTREAAERVKREIEARLALSDCGFLVEGKAKIPTFGEYAVRWQKEHVDTHCKPSSAVKHEQVLRLYLLPKLSDKRLHQISRADLKGLLADLLAGRKPDRSTRGDNGLVRKHRRRIAAGNFDETTARADVAAAKLKPGELQMLLREARKLSRNSIRLILAMARVIFNHAIEDGLIEANPAAKLDRFSKVLKADFSAVPLSREEAEAFLRSAQEFCPRYYPLFLTALRAGLRRGELVALKWGDMQFGTSEEDANRYILLQRNYVYGQFTTPKSKKPRRVDLSRQLRTTLLALRDERLMKAFLDGKSSVGEDLVFPAPEGGVLDPDRLYTRYFLPVLEKAGLRRIRFHDLRHSFGSMLLQTGAPLPYVRDRMGHSSIQVTADVYGHMLPGANIACIDKLDAPTIPQLSATQAQPAGSDVPSEVRQLVEKIGAGGGNRTHDLGIMRPSLYH